MSESRLDDTAMTSSSSLTSDVNRVLRLNVDKAANNSRYFALPWRQSVKNDKTPTTRRKNDEDVDDDDVDVGTVNHSNAKLSNGFLRNIKKRLRIKNISLCKNKQKIKAIDAQRPADEVAGQASTIDERRPSGGVDRDPTRSNSRLASIGDDFAASNEVDCGLENPEADACWDSYLALAEARDGVTTSSWPNDPAHDRSHSDHARRDDFADGDEAAEVAGPIVRAGNVAEPQSTSARESIEDSTACVDAQLANDTRAKVNLSEELLKLSKYGWYWGPISGDEADSKLVSEPDGAFLVRDSSDDRYLLTLSFKSSGRLLHARMEHSGGLFSLCDQGDNEGFTSVAALIDHSMNSSQSAVFCYSRPRYEGHPSFPVRLTKPVSRFTQVRSLQYLCRFVIRQNTRLDNIHKLPLPKTIRGYVEEAHY